MFKLPQMNTILIKTIALKADSCDAGVNKKQFQAVFPWFDHHSTHVLRVFPLSRHQDSRNRRACKAISALSA